MATTLRAKALAVLRTGRLSVISAKAEPGNVVVDVTAAVQSSRIGGLTYAVDYSFGSWSCTCREQYGCAHIAAAQLVTGHADPELRGAA